MYAESQYMPPPTALGMGIGGHPCHRLSVQSQHGLSTTVGQCGVVRVWRVGGWGGKVHTTTWGFTVAYSTGT